MESLIKSNIYRILHYKKAIKGSIFGVIFVTLINIIDIMLEADGLNNIKGNDYLNDFFGSELILIYLAVIVTVLCSKGINDKTINYETINGYKWHEILFSRIITISIFQIILIFFVQSLAFVVLSLVNGYGGQISIFWVYLEELLVLLSFVIVFIVSELIFQKTMIAAVISVLLVIISSIGNNEGTGWKPLAFYNLSYNASLKNSLIDFVMLIGIIILFYYISLFIWNRRKKG